jgi:cephalosporin hydroxylase
MSDDLIQKFNLHYYNTESTWTERTFMGHRILKCPLDLWIYQEIFNEVKPDIIIETGTHSGGSALYWASLCALYDHGKVISIDNAPQAQPEHPRVQYITGDSISPETIKTVKDLISEIENPVVLVNLDSLHLYAHVSAELKLYSSMVTKGSYLIVEDTNLNGHPVDWNQQAFGNVGPWEATRDFLLDHPEFVVEKSRECLFVTFNPDGYLKRVK